MFRQSRLGNCLACALGVLLFLSSGQILVAQSPDPLLWNLAPERCLMYSAWDGGGEANANSTNKTEQLMAEPEVQAFFGQIKQRLTQLPAMALRNESAVKQAAARTLAPQVISMFTSKPGAMFIESVTPAANGIEISAGFAIRVGEEAESILGTAMTLAVMEGSPELPKVDLEGATFYEITLPPPVASSLFVGATDDCLVAALGLKTAERVVSQVDQPKSADLPNWAASLSKSTSVERPGSVGYFNIREVLRLVQMFGGEDAREAMQFVAMLGIDGLESLEVTNGLEGEGMVNRMLLRMSKRPTSVVKLLSGQPLNPESLQKLPADSLFATVFSMDLNESLNVGLDFLRQTSPNDVDNAEDFFRDFSREIGIDIRKDFLEQLGSTWTFYNAAADGILTGLLLKVDVEDPDGLDQTFVELGGVLRGMSRNDRRAPRMLRNRYSGTSIYSVMIPEAPMPIQPSWAVVDGELVVALFPQTIKPLIDRSPEDEMLDLSKYLEGKSAVTALTYTDTKRQYELLYMYASMVYGMMPMLMQESDMGPDAEVFASMLQGIDLPSCRCVYRHLEPSVSVVEQTREGLLSTSWQTMPSVNVSIAAPIGVGLLLPAVQSARAAARRMQSQNNIKQQSLGIWNYESAMKRFPPVFSKDEAGKPLLSWRVHILPFVEGYALYEQFHLDEPWDSEHNRQLLTQMPEVFRSPQSQAPPGFTTYLGVGGKQGVLGDQQGGNATQRGTKGRFPGGVKIGSITDGTSNTVMIVEASDELAVEWTKPVEWVPVEDDFWKLFGTHVGGTNMGLADGSVQFISELIDYEVLKKLFTMNGGEVVDYEDF